VIILGKIGKMLVGDSLIKSWGQLRAVRMEHGGSEGINLSIWFL